MEAEAAYRQAIGILETLATAFPSNSDYRRELVIVYTNLGASLRDGKDFAHAAEVYRKAIPLGEKEAAEESDSHQNSIGLAANYHNPGELLYEAAAVQARAIVAADSTGETAPRERYVTRALELLKRAETAGWFREPRHVKQLKENKTFGALPVDEFKRFLGVLEAGKEGKDKFKKD